MDNHGPLYSDLEVLKRLSGVLDVQVIDAEVPRNINQYVLVRILLNGGVARLILVASSVVKPCPHDETMLKEASECDNPKDAFFTLAEILARRQGKPLDVETWEEEEEKPEGESTILG